SSYYVLRKKTNFDWTEDSIDAVYILQTSTKALDAASSRCCFSTAHIFCSRSRTLANNDWKSCSLSITDGRFDATAALDEHAAPLSSGLIATGIAIGVLPVAAGVVGRGSANETPGTADGKPADTPETAGVWKSSGNWPSDVGTAVTGVCALTAALRRSGGEGVKQFSELVGE
ncbi:hypothetical protein Tcan_08167, partial [Toxocara canis]